MPDPAMLTARTPGAGSFEDRLPELARDTGLVVGKRWGDAGR
jgi:hypothetical protein